MQSSVSIKEPPQVKAFIKRFYDFLEFKMLALEWQVQTFGVVLSINYILYYLIWTMLSPQGYENLPFRISASCLCFFLIFKDFWPKKIKVLLPIYWYLTAIYVLPFFFIFMTLKNHATVLWLMNCVSALFFLILLFDWKSVIVMVLAGGLAGYFFYEISSPGVFVPQDSTVDLVGAVATFGAAFLIGGIFSRNNEKIKQEKIETLITVGESIAHELRTPLKTIKSGASGLQKYLPELLETYQIAERGGLEIPEIEDLHYEILSRTLDNISSEVNFSWTFIDLLLVNANQGVGARPYQACSMQHCVMEALQRYPYDSNEESMIHFEGGDFTFLGDRELMIHIFFNLLKNALYYIKVAGKGRVTISLASHKNNNVLYFKDTAKGISKKALPHVFDRFFSETFHGTGIGLAFCKLVMQNFGGSIACRSEEGEYAEFILTFPVFQKVISDQ